MKKAQLQLLLAPLIIGVVSTVVMFLIVGVPVAWASVKLLGWNKWAIIAIIMVMGYYLFRRK